MDSHSYKLRCTLPGHSKDVRCVTVGNLLNGECIISGSRDKTAKLWTPEGLGYVCTQTFSGSEGYVSTVAITPNNGKIITGCQDGKIRIYNPECINPSETLSGHTDTVCALATAQEYFVSGSWDKTAKIWQYDGSPVLTLTGHSAAIWAVEILSCSSSVSEIVSLTGSADKTIKMWKGNSTLQIFKGHTDCVRALAVCDANRFLSAANDATIRLWLVSGECLATYYGHTNYIYGISMMPSQTEFVSCGEDRSVRIWKLDSPDECHQTIFLPAQSIWTVSVMNNNDIITGSSDGLVRVFTKAAERVAAEDLIKCLEQEVAATALSAQLELGGIKASDLPGPESLFEAGTREGQTKMVRDGQTVSCYSWSSSEGWTKVGDVVGAAGQSESTKTLHDGKEYDYVFSVDIAEGQPPLKLPYNTSEDPWVAAQKFIHDYELSQQYLDTVANFIITNSKPVNGKAGGDSSSGFCDPLTGGSRYVPAQSNAALNSASSSGDPFTGTGRYVPGQSSVPLNTVPSTGDPFTGSGRYVAGTQPVAAATHSSSYFPVRDFLRFDQANIEAISKKILDFNRNVDGEVQLSETDLLEFIRIADLSWRGTIIPHLGTLLRWPTANLFPVLDILRLATRNANICQILSGEEGFLERLLALVHSSVPNCIMVYRMLAHMLQHSSAHPQVVEYREPILNSIASTVVNTDPAFSKHAQWKNVQVAIATVLLNFSALLFKSPAVATVEFKSSLVSTISGVLTSLHEDEAIFRTLAAIGTLMGDEESRALACSLDLNLTIENLQSISGKVGECAKQIALNF